jgi:hypothetical protein
MLSAALGSGSGILSTGPRAPDGNGGGGGGILSPGIVSSSDAEVISSSDAAKVTLFGLLLLLLLGDKIEGLGEGEGINGECLVGEDGAGEFVSDR